jgi:cell wall-associated NlpC family hydrolase
MNLTARAIIDRAQSLVGAPFRPQGRDPATGLDCVGVLLWSFAIPADRVRRDYRMRGAHGPEIEASLSAWFRRTRPDEVRAADVMLFAVSTEQKHLAVNCGNSFVHADASLRRVVETPMVGRWPLIATFRSRRFAQPD